MSFSLDVTDSLGAGEVMVMFVEDFVNVYALQLLFGQIVEGSHTFSINVSTASQADFPLAVYTVSIGVYHFELPSGYSPIALYSDEFMLF